MSALAQLSYLYHNDNPKYTVLYFTQSLFQHWNWLECYLSSLQILVLKSSVNQVLSPISISLSLCLLRVCVVSFSSPHLHKKNSPNIWYLSSSNMVEHIVLRDGLQSNCDTHKHTQRYWANCNCILSSVRLYHQEENRRLKQLCFPLHGAKILWRRLNSFVLKARLEQDFHMLLLILDYKL